MDCTVACNELWDGAVPMRGSDVSHEGIWIDTPYPLEPGEEVVVSFAPPGGRVGEEVWAVAEVARVGLWRRRRDAWPSGMGLAFTYLNAVDRRFLVHSLVGHPPRLPGRRRPPPLPAMREPIALRRDDLRFLDADDELPPVLGAGLADEPITALSELLTAGSGLAPPTALCARASTSWGVAAASFSLLR